MSQTALYLCALWLCVLLFAATVVLFYHTGRELRKVRTSVEHLITYNGEWYIFHEGDVKNPEDKGAYFGPFKEYEIDVRLNDAFADALASTANIDAVKLNDKEREDLYINPRSFWMEQLAQLTKD